MGLAGGANDKNMYCLGVEAASAPYGRKWRRVRYIAHGAAARVGHFTSAACRRRHVPVLVFAALVLLLSVMHAAHMINDAESHWLEGMQLIVTYFM